MKLNTDKIVSHEKYAWKEQLQEAVGTIRKEVREKGGINPRTIDNAVKRFRKNIGPSYA